MVRENWGDQQVTPVDEVLRQQVLSFFAVERRMKMPFDVPVEMDEAWGIEPGTLAYAICWVRCGDVLEVMGYTAGSGYHLVGKGDPEAWLDWCHADETGLLLHLPLGDSDTTATARLVVDCASRSCWAVSQEVMGQVEWLPNAVAHWIQTCPLPC